MEVVKFTLKECFAINLKWYRFSKNYTQERLAELSNLTPKYISDLERGKFSPSLTKIEAIGEALGIEPYLLLKPDNYEKVEMLPAKIDQKLGKRNTRKRS